MQEAEIFAFCAIIYPMYVHICVQTYTVIEHFPSISLLAFVCEFPVMVFILPLIRYFFGTSLDGTCIDIWE